MSSQNLCGFILIDKQPGMTSHFVVSRVKKTLKTDKVGHLGTLDPFASGLLPIMIGGATRLADEVMDGKKGYLFDITFGVETDTLDLAGAVVKEQPVPADFPVRLANVLAQFTGDISQVPPSYSALKMNGMPLYEHMRGTGALPFDIETKRRTIHIFKLDLIKCDSTDGVHKATLRVMCSKGTYIRSLARDLAYAIETVGHCSQLRREFVEPWSTETAVVFDRENQPSAEALLAALQPPRQMVPNISCVEIGETYLKPMSAGNSFQIDASDWQRETRFPVNEPTVVLLGCQDLLFLTELIPSSENSQIKIQPRKKIK